MSKIYQNTFFGIAAGFAFSMIEGNKNGVQPLKFIAAINVFDLIYNKGFSVIKSELPEKVFLSSTQQFLPNCTVVRQEWNYIDIGAKALSIVLAASEFAPEPIGEFVLKNNLAFSLVPCILTAFGEAVGDLMEIDYKTEESWIYDTYGQYSYYQI